MFWKVRNSCSSVGKTRKHRRKFPFHKIRTVEISPEMQAMAKIADLAKFSPSRQFDTSFDEISRKGRRLTRHVGFGEISPRVQQSNAMSWP